MSFLRKLRNGLLGLNHVVFSEKNRELNSVMSFLRKFKNGLLGLIHTVFSEKIENWKGNVTFEKICKKTSCFEPCSLFSEN